MDILGTLEKEHIRGAYSAFYAEKLACFDNTIRAFPQMWQAFGLLDDVWSRELADLEVPGSGQRILPIALFFNAHLRIRLAFELGFCRCLPEACEVLRVGIESVALASRVSEEPHLAKAWLGKNLGMRKQFDAAFRGKRIEKFFLQKYGLDELYRFWKRYSEYGAHASASGLATRIAGKTAEDGAALKFRYLDAPREVAEKVISDMLVCCRTMERVFYKTFGSRLMLDDTLRELRARLASWVSAIVRGLGAKYCRHSLPLY